MEQVPLHILSQATGHRISEAICQSPFPDPAVEFLEGQWLWCASESPGRAVQTQLAGSHPQSVQFKTSGVGPKDLHFLQAPREL